jgi:hypothetical protein
MNRARYRSAQRHLGRRLRYSDLDPHSAGLRINHRRNFANFAFGTYRSIGEKGDRDAHSDLGVIDQRFLHVEDRIARPVLGNRKRGLRRLYYLTGFHIARGDHT